MNTYVVNARFVGMKVTGIQRAAREIVGRLVLEERGRFQLCSPPLTAKSPYPLEVAQRGRIRQGHLWEQVELPGIVRRMGRDAVLYSPMASGPIAVRRQVATMHDLFPVEHPEWFSRAYGAWYRWLWPILLRRVAYVVANSEYTRQRVLEYYGLPEEKVVTCHFAYDERFAPAPTEEVARFRVAQGLPERYLLFVGWDEPRKNLTTLKAAWKRTMARKEGVVLVIAGGAARGGVFNLANSASESAEDPTIRQLGYFSDEHLPLLYQDAEAFAFPSLAEGFGLPVLEAMACGTPVICSNNSALPEIAGSAAQLVPALETEAWTEAIDSILSDGELRQRMRSSGLKRATDFSWSRTAEAVRFLLEAARRE